MPSDTSIIRKSVATKASLLRTHPKEITMSEYQVIVGNIGTVYDGPNPIEANKVYGTYKSLSQCDVGRASGESVTVLRDGEIQHEHIGEQD